MEFADVSSAIKAALDQINLPNWDLTDTYAPQQAGENFRQFGDFIRRGDMVWCTVKVTLDNPKGVIQLRVTAREQSNGLSLEIEGIPIDPQDPGTHSKLRQKIEELRKPR